MNSINTPQPLLIPNFDQIELDSLLKYFEEKICSKKFRYECYDTKNDQIVFIELSSTIENFAHLSGIDKCVDRRTYPNAKSILKGIRNGSITKKYLKDVSLTQNHFKNGSSTKNNTFPTYKNAKKRMRYLSVMDSILSSPSVFRFYPERVLKPTDIKSKYLCIEIFSDQYVHFGIDEFTPPRVNGEFEVVFPRTLLIEGNDTFFENQDEYRVISANVIPSFIESVELKNNIEKTI